MICPECGKEISEDNNFCPNCGCNINNKIDSNSSNYGVLFSVIIIAALVAFSCYTYLSKIGSTINLDDSNIPEIQLKADSCNSPYVENEVISVFKEKDPYFKNIDQKSINTIRLQSKETVSTDEKSAKYICSGIIELQSDSKGFRPSGYDENNSYYHHVYIDYDDSIITRYTSYELPIFYTSQIIEGKNYIEISETGIGEFGCKGICAPIHRYYKKKETVSPQKRINENVVLPEITKGITPFNTVEEQPKSNNSYSDIKPEKKKKKLKLFKRNKKEKTK